MKLFEHEKLITYIEIHTISKAEVFRFPQNLK